MEPKVIFEDSQILVLEKPAGMVVNRARTTRGEETVQDWLMAYGKWLMVEDQVLKESDFSKRAGIVHRLDKETSGILLVGKTKEAFENLQAQFKKRKVEKKYLALVHGKVEPSDSEGEIEAPVGRLAWNRERFGVFPGGREAKTKYKAKKYYTLDARPYTLLELTPTTGRTHQIRVHLKYLGHPVVADSFYAGRKTSRQDRKWCPRLFLHASYIAFAHPKTGKKVSFSSKLPEELKKALKSLEKVPS